MHASSYFFVVPGSPDSFESYRVCADSEYILPGQDAAVNALVTKMVVSRAVPGQPARYNCSSPEEELSLRLLGVLGLATQHVSGSVFSQWTLSEKGFRLVRPARRLVQPSCALANRIVPLHHMTLYELRLMLEADGWTWKRGRTEAEARVVAFESKEMGGGRGNLVVC